MFITVTSAEPPCELDELLIGALTCVPAMAPVDFELDRLAALALAAELELTSVGSLHVGSQTIVPACTGPAKMTVSAVIIARFILTLSQ